MEPFLATTVRSTYATAFSFPLCYTTSDKDSDSELSACSDTFQTAEEGSAPSQVEGNTLRDFTLKNDLQTPSSECSITPAGVVSAEGPDDSSSSDTLSTAKAKYSIKDTRSAIAKEHMAGANTRALTAPPSCTLFAQSGSTSVISSFSSESIPVLLTSSQSQDSTDFESSPLYSDSTDFDQRSSGGSNLSDAHSLLRSTLGETGQSFSDVKSVQKHESSSNLNEETLVNNSELTLSLESVLTVVPLSQAQDTTITGECGGLGRVCSSSSDQCTTEPRHSTSSYGDTSLQSWDSHLEGDPAIDDIVESVVQGLKFHDVDQKPWNGTLHLDNSGTSERKASSASMSSYASSKRLEWDNGADIGYIEAPRKVLANYIGPEFNTGAIPVDVTSSGLKLESKSEGHDDCHVSHVLLRRVEKCTSPWFVPNSFSSDEMKRKSPLNCDVTVQTDVSSVKDAEVQAQNVNSHTLQWAQSKSHAVRTERLSRATSVSQSSDSITNSTVVHQCALLTDRSKPCVNSTSEKPVLTKNSVPDIIQQKSKCEGEDLLKDCARSVAICYSQKFSREFERYVAGKRSHTGIPSSESIDVSASSRKGGGHFIPLGRFESMSGRSLKMQLPATLAGLTSGTDSPAEMPRSSSEMNGHRLGYWLSSGFPYVPSVTPLKLETLPGVTDGARERKMVQDVQAKGEVFPPLSDKALCQPWAEAREARSHWASSPSNTAIRKRYVRRCRPCHLAGSELPLCVSEGSRNITAIGNTTAREEMERNYELSIPFLRGRGMQTAPKSKVTAPSVKQHEPHRSTVGIRKGETNHLSPSQATNDSEGLESSKERSAREKRLETFTDTSSCITGHSSVHGRCRLKRAARKELEKLRTLVDRQKHSYLKRLQKEVNRLQKLEALLVNERDRQILPHTAPATSGSQSHAVPSSSQPPSHSAVQTSSSDTHNSRDRYFVTVTTTSPKKPRRQQHGIRMPGVSWVVPLLPSACSQKGCTPAEIAERLYQLKNFSLQAAFAEKCKHVIRHSEDRLSRLALRAERRRRRVIFPLPLHEQRPVTHRRTQSLRPAGAPQVKMVFTQKEMRQQTEKMYRNLPEVIEQKNKLSREQQYQINRLAVQRYSKMIQRQALKGHVSFAINRPCVIP